MARCLTCGDVVESESVHDYVTCACGLIAVDGGRKYLKRTWPTGAMSEWLDELSETTETDDAE